MSSYFHVKLNSSLSNEKERQSMKIRHSPAVYLQINFKFFLN